MPEENALSFLMFWRRDRKFIEVPGGGGKFLEWEIGDFNKNGKIELAVTYDNYGSAGFHTSYLYEWENSNFKILFSKEKIGSQLEFKDLDNDGIEEILHKFYLDKWVEYWVEIYKWNNKQQDYVKANNLFSEIYKQWLKEKESNLYTSASLANHRQNILKILS